MPRRNLSDAQKDAGNYRKPKVRVHGMEISVENPKGSIRSGVDRSGKPWAIRMTCAYGYFLGTKAGDGDHLDVFLGPDRSSELVFVVNQIRPDGEFDEHKCLVGFRTLAEAKAAYLSNYSPGWKGLGSIVPVTLPKFKAWAFSGKKLRDPLPVDFRALLMPRLLTEFAKPFSGYTPSRHAKTGGLNDNFREKYNRENGSNLKRPVTKEPSKLDPNGKAAKRRKSFCGRMSGVPGPTSKDGKLTPKGAALKRWNCQSMSAPTTDFAVIPLRGITLNTAKSVAGLSGLPPDFNNMRKYVMKPIRVSDKKSLGDLHRQSSRIHQKVSKAAGAWSRKNPEAPLENLPDGILKRQAIAEAVTDYLHPHPRNMSTPTDLTNLEARISRLIDFATPTPRTNTQLLRTSIRPTTDFGTVDRSGGYVTIRDDQGNERRFRQPGVLNAIKRNPGKTAAAVLAVPGIAGAAGYVMKRSQAMRSVRASNAMQNANSAYFKGQMSMIPKAPSGDNLPLKMKFTPRMWM